MRRASRNEKDLETEWLKEADSTALQHSAWILQNAFDSFFRQKQGYPKFKSKHDARQSYQSINNHNSIPFTEEGGSDSEAGRGEVPISEGTGREEPERDGDLGGGRKYSIIVMCESPRPEEGCEDPPEDPEPESGCDPQDDA